jgi:hypothetical protein
MKFEIRLRLNDIFEKLFGQNESASGSTRNFSLRFTLTETSPIKFPLRTTPSHMPLPVQFVAHDYLIGHDGDLFSAQLATYRDQSWWDAQRYDPEDCLTDRDGRKRSLSIREIRERMNSMESTKRTLDEPFDFEPGLKLFDGVRGGWKDMEKFID